MALTWVRFDNWILNQWKQSAYTAIDLDTDTIKCMLTTATYVPSQSAHVFKSDVTNEIASGGGYTTRGNALTTKAITLATGTVSWTADNPTWTQNAGGFSTARIAVIYKDTGTDSTSPLIAYADLSSDRGNVSGDLVLRLAATGILTIT